MSAEGTSERARDKEAMLRAFHEMAFDYVSDVWGRDLGYLAEAIGLPEDTLLKAAYENSRLPEFLMEVRRIEEKPAT